MPYCTPLSQPVCDILPLIIVCRSLPVCIWMYLNKGTDDTFGWSGAGGAQLRSVEGGRELWLPNRSSLLAAVVNHGRDFIIPLRCQAQWCRGSTPFLSLPFHPNWKWSTDHLRARKATWNNTMKTWKRREQALVKLPADWIYRSYMNTL